MTNARSNLLREARNSLQAAILLHSNGYPGFAASRAYYTMFYAAEAALDLEELAFSKHSAVVAAFGRHFAQTGRAPKEFHRYLIEGMEVRHRGDYPTETSVSSETAASNIARARQFLEWAERLMGPAGSGEV